MRDTDKSQYYANQVQRRKIPKISPGAYIFSKAPFEGLIFGGAYIRRGLSREGICVSKSIRLALKLEVNLPLCFSYFLFEGNFPSTSPPGAYICRGDLTEGFLHYRLGGLIFGGAYFRNFTVIVL